VSRNGHDDIAARLRREASATAPERLRADVMVRVHAEPRPQRIRPRRSFARSFASVAAAACILGALVFGASRVDFGGNGAGSVAGGGSVGADKSAVPSADGLATGGLAPRQPLAPKPQEHSVPLGVRRDQAKASILSVVPGPIKGAVYGRYQLAIPLRHTFGALDPYHLRAGARR
jgi:hypothetical protein